MATSPQNASSDGLRLFVAAHQCTGAGAVSVGRNLLASLGRAAPGHRYVVTIPPRLGYEEACAQIPNVTVHVVSPRHGLAGRWFFETFGLPRLVADARPDVYLALGDRGLVRPPCPQAILVHRPQLFYPARHYAAARWDMKARFAYHSLHLWRSLKKTQLLLCQTTAAEARLRARYRFNGRCKVVPNAVSTFIEEGATETPASLAGFRSRFRMLCLTRYYAHKGLEELVRVMGEYPSQLADTLLVLTISREQDPAAARLLDFIAREKLDELVLNVGPIPQSQLAAYYRDCQALILPTRLESFTATYLEAMKYEIPILTSEIDFATTVCEDAAVYFDPWDRQSIFQAIQRLKDSSALRQQVTQRGRARYRQIARTWDEIGLDLAEALAELASAR